MITTFQALVLTAYGQPTVTHLNAGQSGALSSDNIPVDVLYSSINYKDALAVTGQGKIIQGDYPFVPGIDLVGRVRRNTSSYAEGDLVVLTGGGQGERYWGAFAQQQAVPDTYLLKLPDGISPFWSMVVGTAGLTAMLSIMALEVHGVTPDRGRVVVTGASGGVGSFAVALLSALGYIVTAASGKRYRWTHLRTLGASETVDRLQPGRPLEHARYVGAVDAAGGASLAAVLATLARHGSVAASGNAAGATLHTTVYPFILRGVNLLGIDSNTSSRRRRRLAWDRLAELLTASMVQAIHTRTVALGEIPEVCADMVAGKTFGRHVVDPHA